MRTHYLLVVCALLLHAPAWGAAEFYVAPGGDDANPGTKARPFATVQRARDAVRELKAKERLPAGGVTVTLRGGNYALAQPLELGKEDGGTEAAPIAYRAYGKERVWLSGGREIAAALWQPVKDPAMLGRLDPAARGKVVQADLAAAGIPEDVPELPDAFRGFTNKHPVLMELFCGGRRLQLARWPNEGFARFGDIVDTGSGLRDPKGRKRQGRFRFEDDRILRWNAEEGIWLLGYWARAYLCEAVKVGQIDKGKREIEWAVPLGFGLDSWGAKRFYAFNLLCELDRPGEWYLDRKTHTLYLWPPSRGPVTVSCLAAPMVSLKGADYVTFQGLGFQGGRQNAITLSDCSHCRITGCTIRNVGMDGVVVTGGVDDGVVGCDIHDTGYGGVRLSGGDRKTLTPCNHFADNNHIHHTSVVRRTHAGPLSLQGIGLRAAHNLIHHDPHTAIWYGGNDIVMEYNEIYWVMYETTEGGVFYDGYDWTHRGNVIRYNSIHHIIDSLEGTPTRACIVHEDDCVSGTAFEGNLCVMCGEGVAMCGGPDNTADNNLFVYCSPGVTLSARGLDWWNWTKHPDGTVTVVDTRNGATMNNLLRSLEKVPYKEAPWTKYPHLADILERDPAGAPYFCRIARNISYGGKLMQVARNVKPEWVTIERNWDDEGDPGFVNAARGDYRLRQDAPAVRKIGFVPLPVEKMGLVNDGTRASWPVKADPPPAGFRPQWLLQREQQLKAPSALPVLAVPQAYGKIVVDGVVDPQEWAPAQAQGMTYAPNEPAPLAWNYDGKPAPWPSKAWLEADDRNLYIAFLNDVDPSVGASGGQTWGKDDAVEIAVAPMEGGRPGSIIVLRGFSNGAFTSSDEASAPASVVKRALQGTEYACKVQGKAGWTAEWKIPFAALGIEPQRRNPQILFNLSVRKPAGDLWVMWKRGGGYTWEVKNGGVLWLQPFGDILLSGAVPSQANIHVMAATPGLTLKALTNCEVATWAKPAGSRITGGSDDLPGKGWRNWEYAFVADRDGQVSLNLMGRGYQSQTTGSLAPVWTYYDDLTCEGAELKNGGFEEVDSRGKPAGWSVGGGLLITDARGSATGERCAKCWHDGRFVQVIQVKAGQPVRLRMKVGGEGTSR